MGHIYTKTSYLSGHSGFCACFFLNLTTCTLKARLSLLLAQWSPNFSSCLQILFCSNFHYTLLLDCFINTVLIIHCHAQYVEWFLITHTNTHRFSRPAFKITYEAPWALVRTGFKAFLHHIAAGESWKTDAISLVLDFVIVI